MRHFVDVEINHTVHNTTQNVETPKRWTLESNCCWGGVQENAPSLYSSKHQRLLLKPSRKLESSGVFSAEKFEVSKKIGPKTVKMRAFAKRNMFLIFCRHIFSPTSFPQKGWRKCLSDVAGNTHMLTWNCSPCSRRKESGLDLGRQCVHCHGRMYISDLHLSMRRWCFRNPKANHRLDGAKTLVNNGINYQPQLVH